MHSVSGRVSVQGNVARSLDFAVTLTKLASKRSYRRHRSLDSASFEFTEAAGTTVELRACANELDCTKPVRVRVDRDVAVELVLTIPWLGSPPERARFPEVKHLLPIRTSLPACVQG